MLLKDHEWKICCLLHCLLNLPCSVSPSSTAEFFDLAKVSDFNSFFGNRNWPGCLILIGCMRKVLLVQHEDRIDRGSTGSGGSIDLPLFRVRGQSMLFDPHFFMHKSMVGSLFMETLSVTVVVLSKIIKIVATRCQILRLKCTKFDFGWGSAPDPAGGAHSAPPDPIAGFKGAYF